MLTSQEMQYIRSRAYIPEHSVGLMVGVSGAEPFLMEDCLCFLKDDWLILVGYPLAETERKVDLETLKNRMVAHFHPGCLSLMASEIPNSLLSSCMERERDCYYVLTLEEVQEKTAGRTIRKARKILHVERSGTMGKEHLALTQEFIRRADPPLRVKNLFHRMPEYTTSSRDTLVLNARAQGGRLSAFYVVDLEALDFSIYVLGCYSKNPYVPGASDLLFQEMIDLSREKEKKYIHLGLGMNNGIRRFKEKWGGVPTLRYEMCEISMKKPSLLSSLTSWQRALGRRIDSRY